MFQARLPQGNLLKKLIDAIKDLITEANFDVSEAGVQLQAMDTSHVCLIALLLRSDGFEEFRCVLEGARRCASAVDAEPRSKA
jgi:proliferating cell nuclear antigen